MMGCDKCMQEKCSFNPMNLLSDQEIIGMCPVCALCGAPKHVINTDCSECLKCENGEGYIRGKPDGETQDVKVQIKVRSK